MKITNILMTALILSATNSIAQECDMPISIRLDEDFSNVPSAASNTLYRSLSRIALENGLVTEAPTTPFVLTVHCDVLEKNVLPGPPAQVVNNLGVTFYMADTYAQKKFGTAYITLNGVGRGEAKSYIDAFSHINANNKEIKNLINSGKKKMVEYYDKQYPDIIKEAKRLESLQKYEEALAMVLSVPLCSKGGEEVSRYGLQLYTKYLDRLNLYLLNQAKALWTAGQDQGTAFDVCGMLAQIDPDAACYGDAAKLMAEIKSQVRSDIDLEMRQKYNDEVQTERERIAAAKAVGIAFGNNQKPSTTNLMWMK